MTMTTHLLRLALGLVALAMNSLAPAQAIRGELVAADAVRARRALEIHLGVKAAAGYARSKGGCEFPPCTDVQKRFAVFESMVESEPGMNRRRQLICSGEREMPWSCGRQRIVLTPPGSSRDVEVSESLSDVEAAAVLQSLDSDCLATQRAAINAKRGLPAEAKLAEQVFSMEERGQLIRVSMTLQGSRWHYVDLRRTSSSSSCPFEFVAVGTVIS